MARNAFNSETYAGALGDVLVANITSNLLQVEIPL
jgi:hypothetical protein